MNLKKITNALIQAFVITLLLNNITLAQGVRVVGSIQQTIPTASSKHGGMRAIKVEKSIQLLQVTLSEEAKQRLASRAKKALTRRDDFSETSVIPKDSALPSKVEMGMNKVPVLDQGIHGTCSIFAVTGAIDAALGKGDYISQLCSLQLGVYLEKQGHGLSGWNGAHTISTINRIETFGVVSLEKQKTEGCGGLKRYPTYSSRDNKAMMEPAEFSSKSELVFGKVLNWSDLYQEQDPIATLNDVKDALVRGDRVVLSLLIPDPELGAAGAVGRHNTWFFEDTWVLTEDVLKNVEDVKSGHAIIITGYDDKAVAVDDHGDTHKGLLTLRNSWGGGAGDYGDFYMSYDYFKLLAYNVKRFTTTL